VFFSSKTFRFPQGIGVYFSVSEKGAPKFKGAVPKPDVLEQPYHPRLLDKQSLSPQKLKANLRFDVNGSIHTIHNGNVILLYIEPVSKSG
jgi:hypothetical protein